MNVKITGKKLLSLTLSVLMLFSALSVGFTVGAECEHPKLKDYLWEVVRETTCSMSGLKEQWCYDCGTMVKEIIPIDPDAHVPGLWTTVKPKVNCREDGVEAIYCTECELELQRRAIPMHNYNVLYSDEATCLSEGYEFIACLDCYEMKTQTLPVDPDAHSFSEWQITTVATCVKDSGERTRFCLNTDENGNKCGAVETEKYTDAENHSEIIWDDSLRIPPTCDAPGRLVGTCQGCQNEVVEPIAQHSESSYTVLSTTPSTCHTHGVERRRCQCGLEYDVELELDESNHEYGDWIIRKEADCTPGERYKYCKYHYSSQLTQEIPATGEHCYGEWERVIEPDCSKTGLEKKVCASCGDEVTRELPTKHSFTHWETVSEMSCDEKNLITGSKLAKCDKCTYEKYFTIPSIHSFGQWRIVTFASCKDNSPGTKERVCTACGKTEEMTYYQEHDFTSWYVTNEPVCATAEGSGRSGRYTRWCKSCKLFEHKEIPVTHVYGEAEIIKYPTCTESGEELYTCLFCGKEKTEYSDPTDHNYGEAEIGKGQGSAWTAVEAESIKCGEEFVEKSVCLCCGNVRYQTRVKAHSFGNWQCDGGIKCGEGSIAVGSAWRVCTSCGVTQRNSDATVTLDHPNLKTVTVEATCTTSGYTIESCPDCGYSAQVGEIIPAKGHRLSDTWTTVIMPTCSSEGERYLACEECDYLEYKYISRFEHRHMELEPGLAATCTEAGYSPVTYCVNCKQVFDSVEIAPLGHDFPEGSETCTRCKAYKNSDNCLCSCHSESGMEKIFFMIINKLYQLFGINQKCACGVLHYDEPGFFAKLFGRG